MRLGSSLRFVSIAALLVSAGFAQKASSELMAFDATFSLEQFGFWGYDARPGPTWTGTGVGSSGASVSFDHFALATGTRTTSFMGVIATGGFPVTSIQGGRLDGLETGSVMGSPLAGPLLARGQLSPMNAAFFALLGSLSPIPLATPAGGVGLGVGGSQPMNVTLMTAMGTVQRAASAMYGPWTAGALTMMALAKIPAASPLLTTDVDSSIQATGFDARTAGGLGAVSLVTPMRVDIAGGGGGSPGAVGGFGRLTVEFVPEPARLAVLVAGSALLFLLAARRRR